MQYSADLVIVGPDKNMEHLFNGIFAKSAALGIRVPRYQIEIHPHRDAGCLEADELLESQVSRYGHAIVVVNSEESGRSNKVRDTLEAQMEEKLKNTGWGERASAVVVEPGIGRWLLEHSFEGQWSPGTNLQNVLEGVLRKKRVPQSPSLYKELGMKLIDDGEEDPAWKKILSTLKAWFSLRADDALGEQDELFVRLEQSSIAGELEAALDLIFDHVDDLLLAGRFSDVDLLLRRAPIHNIDSALLIGFLTITAAARGKVGARVDFVTRVKAQLLNTMRPEEVSEVMQGLE